MTDLDQSLAEDHAALVKAQQERDVESTGPSRGHGSVRRTTADQLDVHRDWTVQSGVPFPRDEVSHTRFHRLELPDPQKAVDAGLLPQYFPEGLLDDEHVTQPPSANIALDDPTRLKYRDQDPGYAASKATDITVGLDAAKEQVAGAPS